VITEGKMQIKNDTEAMSGIVGEPTDHYREQEQDCEFYLTEA